MSIVSHDSLRKNYNDFFIAKALIPFLQYAIFLSELTEILNLSEN